MSHILLHASGAMAVRAIRLVNLDDIARLSHSMTDTDWEQLLGQPKEAIPWWAFPPLALAARYAEGVPEWVLDALAPHCPRPLRLASERQSLSDVSLSHLCGRCEARLCPDALCVALTRGA
jgi:hypothetical protein